MIHGREDISRKYPYSEDLWQVDSKVDINAEIMIMWVRS